VRHHTIIVGVVFGIMLTTAILAVCASFYQSRRERRHQRKMTSCPQQASATLGMSELHSGGSNGGLHRLSRPEVDITGHLDRMASNHSGGHFAVPIMPSEVLTNGDVVNKTSRVRQQLISSSVPPTCGGSGNETIRSRERRSVAANDDEQTDQLISINHMTSPNVTGQVSQLPNSVQHPDAMSLTGSAIVSSGIISAVATIEQPPFSPSATKSSSILRVKNHGVSGAGHPGVHNEGSSSHHDNEHVNNETVYYRQRYVCNSTSKNNGVQHYSQQQFSTVAPGGVSETTCRSSNSAVGATVISDDEVGAMTSHVARRVIANPGHWAATVKALPNNGHSASVHRHSNHSAAAENTKICSQVLETTAITSQPASLSVEVANTAIAARRSIGLPPPLTEMPCADVCDEFHVETSSRSITGSSKRSAIISRSEPNQSDAPSTYNTRPHKGTHSIVF